MGTLTISLPRMASASALMRAAAVIRQTIEAMRQRIRTRRDTEHLSALPDYLLRDIGISRSEIMSVVLFGGRDVTRRSR